MKKNIDNIEILGDVNKEFAKILTPHAMNFVATLVRQFSKRVEMLLKKRINIQKEIDNGLMPDFLSSTAHIRNKSWTVASIPTDLYDRRVEITGPVDRKMIINALNSGANVYMADFEDSHSPTWEATIRGQINLRDAVHRTIEFVKPDGKQYTLNKEIATLMVRPRGWHLTEKHVLVDGKRIPAALFDFGLYFFHNANQLLKNKTGPYFYLPKLENHLEARLWNDVFIAAQHMLNIPQGTIRATVLIETILAAFEMDEILYELRDHSAGLNCGRWDYIFSVIKKFRKNSHFVFPDRALVTMDKHFLKSYVSLLIQTCHLRGIHAIGGMAAQIPIKNDPEANDAAMEKVREDKIREVQAGHDGTWIAHPGLIPIAKEIFDRYMITPNQINVIPKEVITSQDLLTVPEGDITEAGLRSNINIGVSYLAAWLSGNGCVPLYNLMEDAATAEISRAQIWQWIRHTNGVLKDGRDVTIELFRQVLQEELNTIKNEIGEAAYTSYKYELASTLFDRIITDKEFVEFITLPAYEYLK